MIWQFDNSNTYLLGSIHVLKHANHPYSRQIDDIYAHASHIIIEADLDNIPFPLLTYNDGTKLSDHISRDTFLQVQNLWISLGLQVTELDKNKSWFVAMILMMKLLEKHGFSHEYGIDKQIFSRAKADNKKIYFLEPESAAFTCFENIPKDEQEEYLLSLIDGTDTGIRIFNSIFEAWSTNNITLLTTILQEYLTTYPSLFQCLVIDRNKAWLRTITTSIESDTPTLIAVGALHCVDTCSIQQLTRDIHGYKATLITNKALL